MRQSQTNLQDSQLRYSLCVLRLLPAEALATVALPECADSIESHPWLDNVFALATYQVDQQEVDRELGNGKDDQEGGSEANSSSSSPPYTRKGLLRLYQGTLQGDGSIDW